MNILILSNLGLLVLWVTLNFLASKRYITASMRGMTWHKEQLDKFVKTTTEITIPEMVKESLSKQKNRLDLLSRENNELRVENEFLLEKLKNLGFTDITLKH